jgi:hypothetical protein
MNWSKFLSEKIGVIFFCVLFSGCNSVMIFGKYGRYHLEPGEINSYPIAGYLIPEFERFCYNGSDAVFLNRAVESTMDSSMMFISVSESILQNDINRILNEDTTASVLKFKSLVIDKQRVDCTIFFKSNAFITRYSYVEKRSALLVIIDKVFSNIVQAQEYYDEADLILHAKFRV